MSFLLHDCANYLEKSGCFKLKNILIVSKTILIRSGTQTHKKKQRAIPFSLFKNAPERYYLKKRCGPLFSQITSQLMKQACS